MQTIWIPSGFFGAVDEGRHTQMSFKDFCTSHRTMDHAQASGAKTASAAKQAAAPAKTGDKAKVQAPAK